MSKSNGSRNQLILAAAIICLLIPSGVLAQICGDADGNSMINLLDMTYLANYVFQGGAAPPNYLDGNADGCGGPNVAVNLLDVQYIHAYLFGGPAPSGCASTTDCSTVQAGNEIRIGDPPYTAYPGGDSVAIPVYITTASTMNVVSVALNYSSEAGETINSVDWTGSVFNATYRNAAFNAAGKEVLIGGYYTTGGMTTQTDGLFVILNARVNGPKSQDSYSFGQTFYSPAGEFLFQSTGGLILNPTLVLPKEPFHVTNTDNTGIGSLNWAITEANNASGRDTIYIDVSGTLDLTMSLPALTDDSTIIVGGTAPSGPRSFIIDGAGSFPGLNLLSSNHHITDLIIYDCSSYHININGDSNIVAGCYINVDETGANPGTMGSGVIITAGSEYNIIGGCAPNAENVIGSDTSPAVIIAGDNNRVSGNLIGVAADGTTPLYLSDRAITCSGKFNTIGGTDVDCRNVIHADEAIELTGDENSVLYNFIGLTKDGDDVLISSFGGQTDIGIYSIGKLNQIGDESGHGNYIAGMFTAIQMGPGSDSSLVFGNYFGTDTTGRVGLEQYRGGFVIRSRYNRIGDTAPGFGNIICSSDSSGIEFSGGDSNIVAGNWIGTNPEGDSLPNASGVKFTNGAGNFNTIFKNRIANNTQNGIVIDSTVSTVRNTFSQNRIYKNGLLGIDLRDDGVTFNDGGDGDSGPNGLLNFPEIDSLFMNADSTFTVYGKAADSATVEFFTAHPAGDSSRPPDPGGYGEAYNFIISDTCDETGLFIVDIPNLVAQFSKITATATDTFGNTSEFCENFVLTPAPLIIVGYSPINLQVTDPDGGFIGRDAFGTLTQTIFPASYTDIDNDSIHIDYPLLGEYVIEVIGEDGADPGAIYSIGIRIDGTANAVIAMDQLVPATGEVDEYTYYVEEDYHYLNGDVDRNEIINLLDILYLIDYKFKHGPAPYPEAAADANCDLLVNLIDILYLIDYKFKEGPAPCPLVE